MLIRVRPGSAREHRRYRQKADEAQYHVQSGIAKLALQVKSSGDEFRDAVGRPFYHFHDAINCYDSFSSEDDVHSQSFW